MADNQRIEDLRRRVQRDPTSIAFAQLAEELRRAGQIEESIDTCRAGLEIHPAYLSARVTLGRALLELNELEGAQAELELVLKSAPENLAAIRGLGEIHHRRGELGEALVQYRAALALARNDPDLQETVAQLARAIEPQQPAVPDEGLSFEQMQNELLRHASPPAEPAEPASAAQAHAPAPEAAPASAAQAHAPAPDAAPASAVQITLSPAESAAPASAAETEPPLASAPQVAPSPALLVEPAPPSASQRPWEDPDEASRSEQARPLQEEHATVLTVSDYLGAELAQPWLEPAQPSPEPAQPPPVVSGPLAVTAMLEEDPRREHAARTVAALEQWLAAINVARADRRA